MATRRRGAGFPKGARGERTEPAGGVAGGSPPPPPSGAALPFPVVGVGASAGGLEALEELLAAVPERPGVAFVVVTHQRAGQVTLLESILAKHSALPVRTAEDGVSVAVDHVYLSKPGFDVALQGGRLQLVEFSAPGVHAPIDFFFQTLAREQRELAVGVVLSGTGSDGTRGLVAIKAGAGLTMAQEPGSAKYDGMPRSAIESSAVDYVAPASELPARLQGYVRSPHAPWKVRSESLSDALRKVLVLLRNRTGADFASYKESTVRRRIERRMGLHQVEDADEYLRYVQANEGELDALFRELLIGVTSFFRDDDAWSELATAVRELCAERPEGHVLRAWVAGCSTGEEAYSLAILLRECLEEAGRAVDVQVFATDLDDRAIGVAREGWYPASVAFDITPARLRRYFVAKDDGYRVGRDVREMVVFAVQNVLEDPPFTKLDVLVCRNLLIYLAPDVQQRLLPLLHYALAPDGLLFLGPSESLGEGASLFATVSERWRLYRRRMATVPLRRVSRVSSARAIDPRDGGGSVEAGPHPAGLASLVERRLLRTFVPATVVVDGKGDMVYVHGHTGDYLEPAQGEPTRRVVDMAREGLRLELPAAMHEAHEQGETVVREAIRIEADQRVVETRLTVRPIGDLDELAGGCLVSFEPVRGAERQEHSQEHPPGRAGGRRRRGAEAKRVAALERELDRRSETHRVTVRELEISNEELKSANEELQSTNEELQSANEELETSREELQSLNEELQTVNAELQDKMEALSRAHDDMQNLLDGTDIATLFLDRELRIKRFTEQARLLVNVIDTDIGRPLGDLAHHLRYDGLIDDASEVLRTLAPKEAEVRTKEGRWRLMRILPYRTSDNVIDGVVVTFIDIDAIKRAERTSEEDRLLTQAVMEVGDLGFAVLDQGLTVLRANRAFARMSGDAPEDLQRRGLFDIGGGTWDVPELREMLEHRIGHEHPTEVRIGGDDVWVRVGYVMDDPAGPGNLLLVTDPAAPRTR